MNLSTPSLLLLVFLFGCLVLRVGIWVFEKLDLWHYIFAAITAIVSVFIYPGKDQLIAHSNKNVLQSGTRVEDERPIEIERKSLTYLRFNHLTDLYEFGNDLTRLTAHPGQIKFITLSEEYTDPYFTTAIPAPAHLGKFGFYYVFGYQL